MKFILTRALASHYILVLPQNKKESRKKIVLLQLLILDVLQNDLIQRNVYMHFFHDIR